MQVCFACYENSWAVSAEGSVLSSGAIILPYHAQFGENAGLLEITQNTDLQSLRT